MRAVIAIHNVVNERAWKHVLEWEVPCHCALMMLFVISSSVEASSDAAAPPSACRRITKQ